MDPEVAVNKAVQTMIMKGIVSEDDRGDAREIAMQIWTAGYDYRGKELQAHNKSRIVQFNLKGVKIGEYDSIIEAAKQPGYHPIYGRNAIGNVLSGKYRHTKQGHIWKYAGDENTH